MVWGTHKRVSDPCWFRYVPQNSFKFLNIFIIAKCFHSLKIVVFDFHNNAIKINIVMLPYTA